MFCQEINAKISSEALGTRAEEIRPPCKLDLGFDWKESLAGICRLHLDLHDFGTQNVG